MALVTAFTVGSGLYGGFKNEYNTMSHSDKTGLARVGQGFKSFGKGFVKGAIGFEEGGTCSSTGMHKLHKDEVVIPKNKVKKVLKESKTAKEISKRRGKPVK